VCSCGDQPSLLRLSAPSDGGGTVEARLSAGDAYVLAGPSHYGAMHEVAAGKSDFSNGGGSRLSVTLRYFFCGMGSTWTSGDHSAGANHERKAD
jgi:hypothetical protein